MSERKRMTDLTREEAGYLVIVFTDAAHLIREDGWVQGAYNPSTGEHCLFGAVTEVVNADCYLFEEQGWIAEALGVSAGIPLSSGWEEFDETLLDRWETAITNWNDEKGRTDSEVIIALEQAVANLKGVL